MSITQSAAFGVRPSAASICLSRAGSASRVSAVASTTAWLWKWRASPALMLGPLTRREAASIRPSTASDSIARSSTSGEARLVPSSST